MAISDENRERRLTISSAVWIQYTNVTDRQTDRQTPGDSEDRAYAQRRAVTSCRRNFSHLTEFLCIDDDGDAMLY